LFAQVIVSTEFQWKLVIQELKRHRVNYWCDD